MSSIQVIEGIIFKTAAVIGLSTIQALIYLLSKKVSKNHEYVHNLNYVPLCRAFIIVLAVHQTCLKAGIDLKSSLYMHIYFGSVLHMV
jgi:hypothetical protein